MPLAEACLEGNGGGRPIFFEGSAGPSFGDTSLGGAVRRACVPAGGALATEESVTKTFPAVVLFGRRAAGKGGGRPGPAPLPEVTGVWGGPSGAGELSAIFLSAWVNAKNRDVQTGHFAGSQ